MYEYGLSYYVHARQNTNNTLIYNWWSMETFRVIN